MCPGSHVKLVLLKAREETIIMVVWVHADVAKQCISSFDGNASSTGLFG